MFSKKRYSFFTSCVAYRHHFYITKENKIRGFGSIVKSHQSPKHELDVDNKIQERIIKVSLGCNHSVFLTENFVVYTSGYNGNGQLCIGTRTKKELSKVDTAKYCKGLVSDVCAGSGITLIVCHESFSQCDLIFGGGRNNNGQLGIGIAEDREYPTKMKLDGKIVKNLAAGNDYTAILDGFGDIYFTGQLYHVYGKTKKVRSLSPILLQPYVNGKVKNTCKFIAMSGGLHHIIAVTNGKRIFGCGDPSKRCLGKKYKTYHNQAKELFSIVDLQDLNSFLSGNFEDVCCGYDVTYFLMNSGDLYGIGKVLSEIRSRYGSRYNNSDKDIWNSKLIMKNVRQICVGKFQSFLFLKDGKCLCIGENRSNSLGLDGNVEGMGNMTWNVSKWTENKGICNLREEVIEFNSFLLKVLDSKAYFDVIIKCVS